MALSSWCASPGELEDWQASMRKGSRLPVWIKLIEEDPNRLSAIDSLSHKDVFRSQFRANRDSPKSEVAVLSWGLDHIDRIRKSKIASQEVSAKSWQMWLVFFIGVANIVATIAVAVVKGNESSPSKPAATAAKPIIPPGLAHKAAQGPVNSNVRHQTGNS